jgi:hypothetical protein
MTAHSLIVGGSTAKRVIACPGSVALGQQMPPRPSSDYADEGTMLHDFIAEYLEGDFPAERLIGNIHANGMALTEELYEDKLAPAIAALGEIDPDNLMEYEVEQRVDFGAYMPGVFGSVDLIGRMVVPNDGGMAVKRTIVLDWKFGSGVMVDVEENEQLMFYCAAAMRSPETQWAFEDESEIELIIVQPPHIKRWVTTPKRIKQFERQLKKAVSAALSPGASLRAGDHCKWCAAKPICPEMNGSADRMLKAKLEALPVDQIAHMLDQAPLLEQFIADLRQLAHGLLDEGEKVPGWKLVNKRASRQWVGEAQAGEAIEAAGLAHDEAYVTKIISPAQAEKVMKKLKLGPLPDGIVTSISSGTTLAPEDDPRAEAVQIGQMLSRALAKVQ